ncbi:hypothetical protein F4677DRAFT_219235 [Hypoxylon crocopeplum]|nr:hypothetical protein F4677DRAFT_219235 [Hypoxylon crocopeplum]
MASFSFSTPSPPGRVRTPNTPRFGYADSWEPFSPRKSARISAQRSIQRTPSPRPSSHYNTRASTKSTSSDIFSTPTTSPQKKRAPGMDSVRRASDALTLGIPSQQKPKATTAPSRSATMLPTPVKTPQKQPDEKAKAKVRAVARNLFSSEDDALATPKKRKAKKYTGLTLESFTAEDVEDPIQIFTDTRDRVPEVDSQADNPFYGAHPEPSKKRSKTKQVSVPGEDKQSLDEALHREDGIVYVFRGKKIFRKFSSGEDGDSQADGEDVNVELGSPRLRPLTRSSVKPRLLFPTVQKGKAAAKSEDEEAATDIEDHVLGDAEDDQMEVPATPTSKVHDKPDTPVAPRFAPASPPSTVRATRTSSKLDAGGSPVKQHKPRSPFDGWRRSKSRAMPHGQKREGDSLAGTDEVSKRQRA